MSAWLARVEAAVPDEWDLEYLFVGTRNDPTRGVIKTTADLFDRTVHYVDTAENVKDEPLDHKWHTAAYEKMVQLRNMLLEEVRNLRPDLFLSLDSDILCHPNQITNLVDTITRDERGFDAVGGKVFLSPGKAAPSWAYYNELKGGLRRSDIDYVTPVDVIMAIKLMAPPAYSVDYKFHRLGEDIGWSLACAEAGLKLAHDGRLASKHIMSKTNSEGLEKPDLRCGW